MTSLTALLHVSNDARCLGRSLETLHPCDEIVIVDHDSSDATQRIAREYGARIVPFTSPLPSFYLGLANFDWILCLDPRETLTESLAASLYEWKLAPLANPATAFRLHVREETVNGWLDLPAPQTRLISKSMTRWHGLFPADDPSAPTLQGCLLRFSLSLR